MLSKINDIIKSVGAELVAVEGHTDSIGSDNLNKTLSTKRAISVANYLAALAGGYKIGYIGYGESRPIASNETKEGRAINRRVDLVVTVRK
jgi:OOP family OmpA-OmpF porin